MHNTIPQGTTTTSTTPPATSRIENYESELPVSGGIAAGIVGSVGVIAVVTALIVTAGEDIWLAPRTIASVIYGSDAFSGTLPIVVGTIIHFVTGGVEGGLFAAIMPRMPRPFWIVAGIIYGLAAWLVASFVLVPLVVPLMTSTAGYLDILLIGHLAYGFVLGLGGTVYGLWRN